MRTFSDDIIQFVHHHFERRVLQSVYETLDRAGLHTPRVIRAVLFLSGGSIVMLKHYAEAAQADVGQVLTWAECVTDVAPEPMFVRDMSLPFTHEANLGAV